MLSDVDRERMDVAHAAMDRLLRGLKGRGRLKGTDLEKMRLVEEAVQRLEAARLL
jgi:hypothetical protein